MGTTEFTSEGMGVNACRTGLERVQNAAWRSGVTCARQNLGGVLYGICRLDAGSR